MNRFKKKIRKLLRIDQRAEALVKKIMQRNLLQPIRETRQDDVFIAAFPKSGNTWMQHLITGLILNSDSYHITPQLVSEFVPDEHSKSYYKRLFPQMVFKTHNLPEKRYRRVIHLVRDGRDAMVSYHKMEKNRNPDYPYSLQDMIQNGKGVYPDKWHIHTELWNKNPYNADIIHIRYEDLLNQPLTALMKIADFLNLTIPEERIQQIYDANHISKLRKKVEEYGWDYDHKYQRGNSQSFFRKGEPGSYEKELTPELVKYFTKESEVALSYYDYI